MPTKPRQRRSRTPHCPHPDCPSNREPRKIDPRKAAQCTLNKPLWMVIPEEGVHISCPVHPEGHHIYGPSITWDETPIRRENNLSNPANKPQCEYEYDPSKDLTFDSTNPYGTSTGFTGKDSFKFSM